VANNAQRENAVHQRYKEHRLSADEPPQGGGGGLFPPPSLYPPIPPTPRVRPTQPRGRRGIDPMYKPPDDCALLDSSHSSRCRSECSRQSQRMFSTQSRLLAASDRSLPSEVANPGHTQSSSSLRQLGISRSASLTRHSDVPSLARHSDVPSLTRHSDVTALAHHSDVTALARQ